MAGIPFHGAWRLLSEALDAADTPQASASFILPGADALEGFDELLGGEGDAPRERPGEAGVPFPLPAMLPDEAGGEARLCADIDFGRLCGSRAVLAFDALCGEGDVLLGGEKIASFGAGVYAGELALAPCALALDLTGALHLGRRQTLTLRFSAKRPAGVPGPVTLRVARDAWLRRAVVLPKAAERTLTVRAQIEAQAEGLYVLEAQPSCASAVSATLRIGEGLTREIEMSVPMPGALFRPGTPYDAPALRLTLYRRGATRAQGVRQARGRFGLFPKKAPAMPAFARMKGALCDGATLLCGYPGEAPRAWLPLTREECLRPEPDLPNRLHALGVTGVSLPCPAQDWLYRALTRLGIGVRQSGLQDEAAKDALSRYPCVSLAQTGSAPLSPAMAAWQLGGVTGQMRTADPSMTDTELLADAFGRHVDPDAPGACDVLRWLRAVRVRLLCEAARQHRYTGALCNPGEWRDPDVAQALETALAETHVGVLPLLGAWWAGAGFSASVCAFTGAGAGASLTAEAALEDEDGATLARETFACPPSGGKLGVLRARLPERACVLTLHARLMCGAHVVEESAMPVYVGQRGVLEAALP